MATSTEFHTEVSYAPCLRFSVVKCLGIAFFTSIGRLEELWNREAEYRLPRFPPRPNLAP